MIGGCGAGLGFFVAGAIQHGKHLQDADAAGTGRRRSDDVVALVVAFEGFALDGLVFAKIVESNQPTVFLHFAGQDVSGFAFIEILGAIVSDAFERACQLRLLEVLVPIVKAAVLKENALGVRELREGIGVRFERTHLRVRDWKA